MLIDDDVPDKKLVLVTDNLNAHSLSSLYETAKHAEARPIFDRIEIHYTPKHGSWLNIAKSRSAC